MLFFAIQSYLKMSTLDLSQQFYGRIVLKMNSLKLSEYLRYGDQ